MIQGVCKKVLFYYYIQEVKMIIVTFTVLTKKKSIHLKGILIPSD